MLYNVVLVSIVPFWCIFNFSYCVQGFNIELENIDSNSVCSLYREQFCLNSV